METHYQKFLNNLKENGKDHFEIVNLTDSGFQFEVFLNNLGVENGNSFQIENGSTGESRTIKRRQTPPYMQIQAVKSNWVCQPQLSIKSA